MAIIGMSGSPASKLADSLKDAQHELLGGCSFKNGRRCIEISSFKAVFMHFHAFPCIFHPFSMRFIFKSHERSRLEVVSAPFDPQVLPGWLDRLRLGRLVPLHGLPLARGCRAGLLQGHFKGCKHMKTCEICEESLKNIQKTTLKVTT